MVTVGGKTYNTFKGQNGATKVAGGNKPSKNAQAIKDYNTTGKNSVSGVQQPVKNAEAVAKYGGQRIQKETVSEPQPFLAPGQTQTATLQASVQPVSSQQAAPVQQRSAAEIYTLLNPATAATAYGIQKQNNLQPVAESTNQGTIYRNEFGQLYYGVASSEEGTILNALPQPKIKLSQQVLPNKQGEGFLAPNFFIATERRRDIIKAGEYLVENAKAPGILGVQRSPLGEKLRTVIGSNLEELGYNPKQYVLQNVVLPAEGGAAIGAASTAATKGAGVLVLKAGGSIRAASYATRALDVTLGVTGTASVIGVVASRSAAEQRPDVVFGVLGTIAGAKTPNPFEQNNAQEFYSGIPAPKNRAQRLNLATKNKPLGKAELRKQSFGQQYNPNVATTPTFVQERLPSLYRSVELVNAGDTARTTVAQLKRTGAGTAIVAKQVDFSRSLGITAERRALGVLPPGEATTQGGKGFSRPPSQVKTNFGNPELQLNSILTLERSNSFASKGKTGNVPASFTPRPINTPVDTVLVEPTPAQPSTKNTFRNQLPGVRQKTGRESVFEKIKAQILSKYKPAQPTYYETALQIVPSKDIALQRSIPTLATQDARYNTAVQQQRTVNPATTLAQDLVVRQNNPLAQQPYNVFDRYATTRSTVVSPGILFTPATTPTQITSPLTLPRQEQPQNTLPATATSQASKPKQEQKPATIQIPAVSPITTPASSSSSRHGGGGGSSRPPTPTPTPQPPTPPPPVLITPRPQSQPKQPILTLRTTTPPEVLTTPGFKLPSRKTEGVQAGFNVLVRTKGQFKQVNAQPLSKEQALDLGIIKVRHTAAASLRIVPARRGAVRTNYPKQNLRGFYRSTKEPGVLIQLPQTRITTTGEKKEIPYKSKQIRFGKASIARLLGIKK